VLSEVQRSVARIGIIRKGVLGEAMLVDDLLRKAAAAAPMEVELAEPPPADAFDRVPGVSRATISGTRVVVELDGSPVAPVLARAAALGAVHLTTERPELEDLFMTLYGDVGAADGPGPGGDDDGDDGGNEGGS